MTVDTRIFRVGDSDFYGDEILDAGKTHTNKKLKEISTAGFTGIWLRGRLRDLAPGELFADYVTLVSQRLKSLKDLCARAKEHNLGVWLFFTEPLGLECDHQFWKDNPSLKGHRTQIMDEPAEYAMCSSTPEVQNYLRSGFKEIFDVAEVAGVLLITSSEQVNNCWAHVVSSPENYPSPEAFWADECRCPRCSVRKPVEVIAEILNTINQGIKESTNPGKVVSWDWSWNMHCTPPYGDIINLLDDDIMLMGDFERGSKLTRLGKERTLEEYSLVCPGPSQRFNTKVQEYSRNRDVFAKLQINTTHELGTVPNLPLLVSLFRKAKYMNQNGVSGTMACWNFGCSVDTLNVYAFNKFACDANLGEERQALQQLAKDFFSANDAQAEAIVDSWYGFQEAVNSYPVNGYLFLYWSPLNYSLAYPLKDKFENKPMGPSWLTHEWGDKLEDSLGEYSLDEMITLLEGLSNNWNSKLLQYKEVLSKCSGAANAKKELAVATIAGASFRSVYNVYRWYRLNKYLKFSDQSEKAEILTDEIENLKVALASAQKDSRLGYHQEAQAYMYSVEAIRAKIEDLESKLKGLN